MPDPQSVLPFVRRRCRPGLVGGAVALALLLTACGGDDDSASTGTGTGTTAPATTTTGKAGPVDAGARLTVKLTPEQTGTPDRPRPVRVAADLLIEPTPDEEAPTVRGVELAIPAGVRFRPEELTACPTERLEEEGPSGCPADARIGRGTLTARAGTIEVEGRATAVYGGDDRILLWVEIANPVSVGAALSGRLTEQPDGGSRLALRVPADLQEVAGLPVSLDRLRLSLGRDGALATTACPSGGLAFSAQLDIGEPAPVEATATADCR